MLENQEHGARIPNTHENSVRKSRDSFLGTLFKNIGSLFRRLSGMGSPRVSRGMDEKVSRHVPTPHDMSREEKYMNGIFRWRIPERMDKNGIPEESEFYGFEREGKVEYILFKDGSRMRTDMLGKHAVFVPRVEEAVHESGPSISDVLGIPEEGEISMAQRLGVAEEEEVSMAQMLGIPEEGDTRSMSEILGIPEEETVHKSPLPKFVSPGLEEPGVVGYNPVVSILQKAKRKNEKISITLSLKLPSADLYRVIKESFDGADDIVLEDAMSQVQESLLRDALRKELQAIYQKRSK